MKNQTKRTKKIAKKRVLRKDYERRRNINRQPPSELKEFEKIIMVPVHDERGKLKTDDNGKVVMREKILIKNKRVKKTLKDKNGKKYLIAPFPKSKKFKIGLKELKKRKEYATMVPQTAT